MWLLPPLATLPDLHLPDADVTTVTAAPAVSVKRVWWDTPDLALTRAGLAVLVEGESWTLSTASTTHRGKAVKGVPQGAVDLLLARLGEAAVDAVAAVRSDSEPLLLASAAGEVVAVVEDVQVSVLEGRRVAARHRQLVLRAEPGSTQRAIADVLGLAGLEPTDVRADLALALGPRAQASEEVVELSPESTAADVLTRALRDGHERLLEADLLVRAGKGKGLRKVRVALRRLRSDLATFAPLLEASDELAGLVDELGELSRVLGAARDLQVHRQRLALAAAADPLLPVDADDVASLDALLAAKEADAQAIATDALMGAEYLALVGRVGELAAVPPVSAAAAGPAGEVLPPLARAAWKTLAKDVKKLEPLGEDETWHDVRKRCKQVRYACDVAAAALGDAPAHTSVQVARVQELLGEHQDAATTAEVLIELGAAGFGVTAGRLAERERTVVRGVRERFAAVWDEVAVPATTAWFKSGGSQ